jgi:hypothetical protein
MSKKPKLTKAEKQAKRAAQIAAMTPEQKAFEAYNNRWHTIGRIWTAVGILLMASIPLLVCLYYNVTPNWAAIGTMSVIIPWITFIASGITEPVIYAPMLGTNGEYLAFITGNLSNMKIPCVVKAREIAETKIGTEENELISTIAIAISSLVTVLVIGVIVLLLIVSGLQGFVERSPYLTPAFGSVVYALFGSLGGKYIVKNPKMAIVPGIAILLLTVLTGGMGSLSLMIGIAFCALFAVYQIMKSKKKSPVVKATAKVVEDAKTGEIEVIAETETLNEVFVEETENNVNETEDVKENENGNNN